MAITSESLAWLTKVVAAQVACARCTKSQRTHAIHRSHQWRTASVARIGWAFTSPTGLIDSAGYEVNLQGTSPGDLRALLRRGQRDWWEREGDGQKVCCLLTGVRGVSHNATALFSFAKSG